VAAKHSAYGFAVAYPSGMRLLPRPKVAAPCSGCGELAGRGYPTCPDCEEHVEKYWVADWLAVLNKERVSAEDLVITVLSDETWGYPWTCVDWALRLSDCVVCGGELATGEPDCVACAAADDRRWAREHTPPSGRMSTNERALRAARVALRAPARFRPAVLSYWRLTIPFLLTGEMTGTENSQWLRASLIAGRYPELASCKRYAELSAALQPPWRDADVFRGA
jgi:hypothetical protein